MNEVAFAVRHLFHKLPVFPEERNTHRVEPAQSVGRFAVLQIAAFTKLALVRIRKKSSLRRMPAKPADSAPPGIW